MTNTTRLNRPSPRDVRASVPSSPARRARMIVGLLVAAVSAVGVVRTFDPVQVSGAQVLFLVSAVAGVALAQVHLDD